MFEETLYQSTAAGKPFVDVLREQGIIPGIKVDTGLQVRPAHLQSSCASQPSPAQMRVSRVSRYMLCMLLLCRAPAAHACLAGNPGSFGSGIDGAAAIGKASATLSAAGAPGHGWRDCDPGPGWPRRPLQGLLRAGRPLCQVRFGPACMALSAVKFVLTRLCFALLAAAAESVCEAEEPTGKPSGEDFDSLCECSICAGSLMTDLQSSQQWHYTHCRWRAVIKIGTPSTPSTTAILENAHGLARYAQIAQVRSRPNLLSRSHGSSLHVCKASLACLVRPACAWSGHHL